MKPRLNMQAIARVVDRQVNPRRRKGQRRSHGFVLIAFKQNESDRPHYVGTIADEDLVTLLKVFLAELEGRLGKAGVA